MMRFPSKSGRFIALMPHEVLEPGGGRGVGFSVVVTAIGVDSFVSQWPCSHLGAGPVKFEFDSTGNLVGIPHDYAFNLGDARELANFVAGHRTPAAWAILLGRAATK